MDELNAQTLYGGLAVVYDFQTEYLSNCMPGADKRPIP